MTNILSFENTEWLPWVIIGALIIWLVFIWKEKHHYPKSIFFINAFVSLIAISALALILLKPLKFSSAKPFKTAILTEGFKESQLDSLKKVYENLVIQRYSPKHKLLKNTTIPETAFILGNGIHPYDLWQLDAIHTIYLNGHEPKGIININYKHHNKIGNQAVFKGRYMNPSKGNTLLLETPDKKGVDSIVFENSNTVNFQLETNLKVQGNFLYHFTEKDALGVIISSDPIPINVSGEKQLTVLVINDFPTFETKYLKNYLAEQGHAVSIKSKITKGRYKYEYFNTSKALSTDLNKKGLEQFDLLIIDAITLNKLSKTKKRIIKEVINDNGLGVYIQSDLPFFGSKNNLTNFNFDKNKFTSVRLESNLKNVAVFPYNFKKEISLQPIHISKTKILSAYKQLGLGKVGTSTFKNTYELLLNGYKNTYQTLWAELIETISKKNITIANWTTKSHIAFKNEPFIFSLATQTPDPLITNKDSLKFALKQDIDIPTLWEGMSYPKKVGWQTLSMEQDLNAKFSYYVTDSTKWQALKTFKTIEENTRQFNANKHLKKGSLKSAEAINLTWLFILFLMSIGYLWLHPKL